MTAPLCPVCGEPAATTVGPVYSGTTRHLWRRRSFEETLFRCPYAHIYSVRVEGDSVTTEAYESVDAWLERKMGSEPPERPPGL
jgi:hypothetical protein